MGQSSVLPSETTQPTERMLGSAGGQLATRRKERIGDDASPEERQGDSCYGKCIRDSPTPGIATLRTAPPTSPHAQGLSAWASLV